MKNPVLKPKSAKWRWIGGSLLVAIIGLSLAAHRVVYGRGRLHQLAISLYRAAKQERLQTAYAGQIAPMTLAAPEAPLVIYGDALAGGWQDWSWATRDLAVKETGESPNVHIRMTVEGFKGLYFHHEPISTAGYTLLEVLVSGDAAVTVRVADGGGSLGRELRLDRYLTSATAPEGATGGKWRRARVPLADLGTGGASGLISGVVFQAARNEPQPDLLLDKIALLPDPQAPALPAETEVSVQVNVDESRHSISPYIYGMAFAPPDYLTDLRVGVNRWGGNDKTRYNWVHGNADNAARDWYWGNRIASSDANAPAAPSSAADAFVASNRAGGAATLLTVPTIGWVARNTDNGLRSEHVPGQGGPPLAGAEGAIEGYDPSENRRRTSVPSFARKGSPFVDPPTNQGVIYQDEWIHHLTRRFGPADAGGVRFYAMDNEPDLWDATHTDVHPASMGYDDLFEKFREYASAVKAVDPTAQITGPVSWGWSGYEYSPLDRGTDNYRTHADRRAHGDEPFLLWFLKQAAAVDRRYGRRILDVLDVHYYPQSLGVFGANADPGTQARRLRATRALWDPSYVDESWIAQPIRLLPRLREWVESGYPGTKIGVTEWNFGGDNDISGALAIAETLGIFGREDVYLANYWAFPPKNSPGYLAFKLYRNADGQGRGFGDLACAASSASPDQVSVFAATDQTAQSVTLILINKMPKTAARVPITFSRTTAPPVGKGDTNPASVPLSLWRVSAAAPAAIAATRELTPLARQAGDGRSVARWTATVALPPYSVTLVRLPVSYLK